MSFINQGLKGVSQNYNIDLLERYQAVTKEDVLAVLKKYFVPLFDPRSSVAVVVTAPAKVDGIAEALAADGFQVEKRTLELGDDEMDGSEYESGSESDSSMEK
jgi:Zn-dependent M16 (insulinase) family peptidase